MTKPKPKSVLDVPAEFLQVSIGDETARLGIKIDRDSLNINAADEALCGRRLTGQIVIAPKGVDPDQQELFEKSEKRVIAATFDVKRFGVSRKAIGAGLTFALPEIDVSELAHFAKRSGRLVVVTIAELPNGKDDEGEGEDEGEGGE